jgi:hypothetical protein
MPISLGGSMARVAMCKAVDTVMEPRLSHNEAESMIQDILDMPRQERMVSARALGNRMRLTNAEREKHKLWTIRPFDMTAKQLADQRRLKNKLRMRKRRSGKSRKRADTPWIDQNISRSTYYRRRETLSVQTTKPVRLFLCAAKSIEGLAHTESHLKECGKSREKQRQAEDSHARLYTAGITDTGFLIGDGKDLERKQNG